MSVPRLVLAAFVLCVLTVPGLAQPGLLAHFPCDEGSGDTTRDAVSGLTATIHGATWVRSAGGACLSFDGVDDYVECPAAPALSPAEAISLAVWVRPDKIPAVGEPGIADKGYHNYALTYYGDGKVWWYTGNSEVNVKAPVAPGAWHHVVGTYGEGVMRLYVDGELAGSVQGKAGKIPATESFFFGTSKGDVQWTKGQTFCGRIDDVRVYNRALTPQEVYQAYLTTNVTHQVELTAIPAYAAGQIIARLDLRGLGELPAGTAVQLALTPTGGRSPVVQQRLTDVASYARLTVTLQAGRLRPGSYDLTAVAVAPTGAVGQPATVAVQWPKPPSWAIRDPHIKVLNNFVSELRSASGITRDTRLRFTNPRAGWAYVQVVGQGRKGTVEATLPDCGDTATLFRLEVAGGKPAEAMRRLSAGPHDLVLRCQGGGQAARVVVRSIPEIGYCRVDCGPQLTPYGPTDWAFLEEHILPNINLAVSRGNEAERERWAEWKRQGKRWIVETPLPGIRNDAEGVTADTVSDHWAKYAKIDESLLDGMIVDEFSAGDGPMWDAWHAALKRLRDDPRFKGKVFYPYCAPLYPAATSKAFAQTCLDEGWAIALERYLPEAHTEVDARAAIQGPLVATVQDWAKAQPEIVPHLLIVTGFLISTPPESTNIDPGVDYKAFMDLQMNVLANDPALFGLYGVTSYLSSYSEEEIIRFTGQLYRHYCIEGRGDRLTDYYELTHLQNPDFDRGLDGWKVSAAEAGSVTVGEMGGLSYLQGRYPMTHRGDNFLLLRRSAKQANRVTQVARGLKPGATYSLKMISADYGDLRQGVSRVAALPVKLEVQGVDLIAAHSFQFPFKSCYSHTVGPFNRANPAGLNMHNLTFRARSSTATVVISDWTTATEPGGPVGQEIACNFLELQPYWEGERRER
jgi:hypothetical protein